jgi:hypothetical protein
LRHGRLGERSQARGENVDSLLARRSNEAGVAIHRGGKAFAYMKRKWKGLTHFLQVPGVPLDNNEIELQVKTARRHRKNSLF